MDPPAHRGNTGNPLDNVAAPSYVAIPFSSTSSKDVYLFRKPLRKDFVARYNEIIPDVEKIVLPFAAEISNGLFSSRPRHQPMSIRLMVLGKTEADAKECIVLFCPEPLHKKVKHLLDTDQIIKGLLEPDDTTLPSFKAVVTDSPSLEAASSSTGLC
jgi:hypothetical protein